MLLVVGTLMAGEGGGASDGSGRRPCASARRRAFLLIAVVSAFVHQTHAHFPVVPDVGDSARWTYGVSSDVGRRPAVLAAAAQTKDGRPGTESQWRRPDSAAYTRHRQRTESDPYGRFIAGSAWKRRSVLGLDNLDYAASVLDMVRSHGQSRQSTDAGGLSTLDNYRQRIINTSGGGRGGEFGVEQKPAILRGASLRRQGGMSMATRLSGPRRGGQPAYGRLGITISPQDVRKMIKILDAGRRR